MKPIYKTWIAIHAALWLLVFAVFDAKAGDLWLGLNFHHISQFDAGPPFNEEDEDAVDHLGVNLTLRDQFAEDWEYYLGVSLGRNFNVTDCSNCWNDGGAEIDSMLFIGVQKKIYEF